MDDIEQKKLEAVLSLVYSPDSPWGYSDAMALAEKITKVFSQFDEPKTEPLEVNVFTEGEPAHSLTWVMFEKNFVSEQEAIDFCKLYGLKIINEPQTKEG